MSMNIDRIRIEKVDAFAVSSMMIMMEGAGFERIKFMPTSEVSHLERYQYALGLDKVTLVYDTVAKILTVDAKKSIIDSLKQFAPQPSLPVNYKPKEIVATTTKKAAIPVLVKKEPDKKNPLQNSKPKPPDVQPVVIKPVAAPQVEKDASEPAKETAKESNNAATLSIAKFTKTRLEWCIKTIKEMSGVTIKTNEETADFADRIYQLKCDNSKVTLQYSKKQTVTIQGKDCKFFDDIKSIISTESDLRQMKKVLPIGYRYLSEPSRIDLSNGMNDLSGCVRLSDYSVLLIAPYRALEKLIYDLQQAEKINVKMIGQAYEKDEAGKYALKKGYIKRIGSIVYSEVMSALYTEYFAIRNFYTHSDNSSESQSRSISNKTEAQNILNNLLSVIEYNCKKLSEIGFNIENN